jgi:hypothetical protein
VFVAVLLDVGLLWLFLTGLLLLVQRSVRPRVIVWSCLVMAIPLLLLKDASLVTEWVMPHWLSVIWFLGSLGISIVFAILWRPSFQPRFDQVQRFVVTLLGFAAISSCATA